MLLLFCYEFIIFVIFYENYNKLKILQNNNKYKFKFDNEKMISNFLKNMIISQKIIINFIKFKIKKINIKKYLLIKV